MEFKTDLLLITERLHVEYDVRISTLAGRDFPLDQTWIADNEGLCSSGNRVLGIAQPEATDVRRNAVCGVEHDNFKPVGIGHRDRHFVLG